MVGTLYTLFDVSLSDVSLVEMTHSATWLCVAGIVSVCVIISILLTAFFRRR